MGSVVVEAAASVAAAEASRAALYALNVLYPVRSAKRRTRGSMRGEGGNDEEPPEKRAMKAAPDDKSRYAKVVVPISREGGTLRTASFRETTDIRRTAQPINGAGKRMLPRHG